jgi:23S rRNA (cytidine1920-2'-O)/16S rRNA (cytidine1409-2'-O)-methyltransferase
MIEAGSVVVTGHPTPKAATLVSRDEAIDVGSGASWASRAGDKLDAALDHFVIEIAGRRALDVGASTGGFTDVLLARGAAAVVAVDVGYGQLITRLAGDPRVTVVDRTNFRTVDPATLGAPFEVVTMDVSFIAAATLAARLAECGEGGTDYVVLVKPQFEVGRERVGRGGIVRDPAAHRAAVTAVIAALGAAGISPVAALPSPVLGGKGNREFLVHGRIGAAGAPAAALVEAALA